MGRFLILNYRNFTEVGLEDSTVSWFLPNHIIKANVKERIVKEEIKKFVKGRQCIANTS